MNDQPVLDSYPPPICAKRARRCNQIPIDTSWRAVVGAFAAAEKLFCRTGAATPTQNVSAMVIRVIAKTSRCGGGQSRVAHATRKGRCKIFWVTPKIIASCDFNHDARSGIVDANQTRVSGKLVKVLVWFDNGGTTPTRMLDIARRWRWWVQNPLESLEPHPIFTVPPMCGRAKSCV